MTPNDVNSAITNDTIYQSGECKDDSNCTAGETDVGDAGVVVLNYGDRFQQGDSKTRTASGSQDGSNPGNTAGGSHMTNGGSGSGAPPKPVVYNCPNGAISFTGIMGCYTKCPCSDEYATSPAKCAAMGYSAS